MYGTCESARMRLSICTCTRARTGTHTKGHKHRHTHKHPHTCTCTCTNTKTHAHTHTHTHRAQVQRSSGEGQVVREQDEIEHQVVQPGVGLDHIHQCPLSSRQCASVSGEYGCAYGPTRRHVRRMHARADRRVGTGKSARLQALSQTGECRHATAYTQNSAHIIHAHARKQSCKRTRTHTPCVHTGRPGKLQPGTVRGEHGQDYSRQT